MIKVGISGARGRMGMMNIESVLNDPALTLTAALEVPGHPDIGKNIGGFFSRTDISIAITDSPDTFLSQCDVVIDFTARAASLDLLAKASERGKKYVLGSTGFTDADKEAITSYAKGTAVVFASNMSVGVNALFALVERATKLLGGFEVEIIEAHHNKKKDSPSGTALSLAEVIASEWSRPLADHAVYGRHGIVGERTKDEIGIHAVRAGDIVGEHTVIFCCDGERVELTHKAHSRKNFSFGAITAVKWLASKTSGLYSMRDVLGI